MLQAALPGHEACDHCTWACFPLSPAIWAQGEGAPQGGGLQQCCSGNACLAFCSCCSASWQLGHPAGLQNCIPSFNR